MTHAEAARAWGPLATPIHGGVPDEAPPWKDNAYLAFWDVASRVYGVCHVSTSPNAEGRRARFSVSVGGSTAEIVEDLEPGSFTSPSIAWDLEDGIALEGAEVSGRLELVPRFAVADYSHNETIPPLVPGAPLRHYQQAAEVHGALVVRGERTSVRGRGIRDRTWGYRDESVSIAEYVAVMGVFDAYALTAMRFLGADGGLRTEGFHLASEATPLEDLAITRDASGLFARGSFSVAGRPASAWRTEGRPAGFWVPMGWERSGPTMAAYDEFCRVDADGERGVALVEQGSVRRVC